MENKNHFMEKTKQYIVENKWLILLVLLNSLILIVFSIINIFGIEKYLNSDSVAEMNFAEQVWRQKTIFPSQWFYGNELSTVRPAILAALIYGITDKFVMSYSMALIITMIFLFLSFVYMMKSLEINLQSILFGTLILIGGFGISFTEMIFVSFGYSGFYIIAIFMSLGYYIRILKQDKIKLSKIQFLIYNVLAILFGIMGIRMTVLLYFPLFVCSCVMFFVFLNNKPHNRIKNIYLAGALLVSNIIGMIINHIQFLKSGYLNVDVSSTKFDMIQEFGENILAVVPKLCESIGAIGGVAIVSLSGIDFMFKLILIMLTCIGIFFCFKRCNEVVKTIISMFSISLIFTIGLQIFSTMDMLPRYFILLGCLIAIVISIIVNYIEKKNIWLSVSFKIVILLIVLINMTSYFPIKGNYKSTEKKVAMYLTENNINNAYSTYWKAGVLKAMSDGEINIIHLDPFITEDNAGSLNLFNWQTDEAMSLKMNDEDKAVLIVDDEEEKILQDNLNSVLNTVDSNKLCDIDNYNIYELYSNPFRQFILPKKGESTIYYPTDNFMQKQNASINSDRSTLSNGDEGFYMFGPYKEILEGIYNFDIEYELLDYSNENKIGYFDVSYNAGAEVLKKVEISKSENHVALNRVQFVLCSSMEIRGYAEKGSEIRVKSIKITRVD